MYDRPLEDVVNWDSSFHKDVHVITWLMSPGSMCQGRYLVDPMYEVNIHVYFVYTGVNQ